MEYAVVAAAPSPVTAAVAKAPDEFGTGGASISWIAYCGAGVGHLAPTEAELTTIASLRFRHSTKVLVLAALVARESFGGMATVVLATLVGSTDGVDGSLESDVFLPKVLVLGAAPTAVVDATVVHVGLTGAPVAAIAVLDGGIISFFRDRELAVDKPSAAATAVAVTPSSFDNFALTVAALAEDALAFD